jgi:hypothetical protein
MLQFFNKNKRAILFVILGALGGLVYWYFNQCDNGTCLITATPYNSMLYGSGMGYFSARL